MQALASDETETSEITTLVSADPVLASEILQAANSALFGRPRMVRTLRHAITLLGREYLRPVLFTAALRAYLRGPGRNRLFREWWRHSLASALLSDGLASACGGARGESYTAGLLHDIGRLGLMMAVGSENHANLDSLEREREQLGTDHCEAGKILMQKWGLPRELAEAALRHHDDLATMQLSLESLVCLACALAATLGFRATKQARLSDVEELRLQLPSSFHWARRLDAGTLKDALDRRIQTFALP